MKFIWTEQQGIDNPKEKKACALTSEDFWSWNWDCAINLVSQKLAETSKCEIIPLLQKWKDSKDQPQQFLLELRPGYVIYFLNFFQLDYFFSFKRENVRLFNLIWLIYCFYPAECLTANPIALL